MRPGRGSPASLFVDSAARGRAPVWPFLFWGREVADDLKDAIASNAEGPAQASGDGISMRQHDLAQQIEADKYLAAKRARTDPRLALLLVKIVPPGAI